MAGARVLTLDQEDFLRRRIWGYLMMNDSPVSASEIAEAFDGVDQFSDNIHPGHFKAEDHRVPMSRAKRCLDQLVGLGYARSEFATCGVDRIGRPVKKWVYTGIDGDWPEMQKDRLSQERNPNADT